MTWEELTWEILTWNVNMFWSPSAIWNAFEFYKSLLVWILPLLKTIAYWIIWILIVFFLLLFVSNKLSERWRKKIKSEKLLNAKENEDVGLEKENPQGNNTPMGNWWDTFTSDNWIEWQ